MSPAEIAGLAPMVVGAGLALFLILLIVQVVRYVRATPGMRRSIWLAVRIRFRWARLAEMAGLCVADKKPTIGAQIGQEFSSDKNRKIEPRTLVPKIKVIPDEYGVIITATCLPKVSLEEFQKAARFLADAWGCVRVSVVPADRPGQVTIRAVREDPLATTTVHVPTGLPPKDVTRWEIGMDEFALPAIVSFNNVPGATVAGGTGKGKTSFLNRLLSDLAPSPLVQFAVIDGKASSADEGDYASIAPRLFRFVGDDLKAANTFLKEMVDLRRRRVALVRSVFGTANMWHQGPTEQWPLIIIIVDEAHTFLRDYKGNDPETKKLAALAADNARLIEDLVKKGRSVGMVTIPTTQKPTGDAIPTFIRDICPVSLSFAQRTTDAAVAALGDDIRDWDDANPVNLQHPSYVGVLVMRADDRPGFIRVRTPYVSDADTARIAAATAYLTRDPIAFIVALEGGPNFRKDYPQGPGSLAA
ncbi:cell division protein FtsK [Streptomyces triticagri]|uniref:Cell division protein FtsK n=1 Tax=Streptomyces triticagri TaxID=2293568 RepID=A0A372LX59_9ACTN|nr:FtsK/SpoIIIE domain-containing protein [Streptomyces triticagri]RFU82885.1 cell division protein FtsK [Streptomyces triticagri]